MRVLFLSLILSTCNIAQTYSYSWFNGYRSSLLRSRANSLPEDWDFCWGEVRSLVAEAPPQKLDVSWPNNVKIEPNITTPVNYMTKRPTLSWPWEQGALYTVMIVDAGIERILPKVYVHWMVTNIPGNLVAHGNEVMEYVTPFSLEMNEDGSIIKDIKQSAHPMILFVFKQPGRIVVDENQAGCSPEIVEDRIHDHRELMKKYNLELKAGNFIQVPWSGYHTQQMICRISKCTREPFPAALPGINDLTECQPREEILDITVVGPKLDKRKEYMRYRSLLSRDSVQAQVQDTYPFSSTGVVVDFLALEGSYNAPYGTNNQADTLEGVIEATFLLYQNASATEYLFKNAAELLPSIPNVFANAAGGRSLKIIMSRPHDQDFDVENLLNKRGMVFDLVISKIKEGREDEHEALKKKMIAKSRSSRNVVSVTTFDVDQEILEAERGGPLFFESENNEISITVFKSQAARRRFRAEVGKDQDFLKKFFSTFDCIMCATMTNNLHETYYPPFNYD